MPENLSELGRFSDVSLLVLASLAGGEKHGYAIMEDIRAFSSVRLEPGSLYGALTRLERRGWIEALPADDRRHPYRLTATGALVLREQVAALERVAATGRARLALL
ncbi:MAG: PadR family transcriptional regulator [Ktedonobacterales bacterium]